jgi:hypothetical protein
LSFSFLQRNVSNTCGVASIVPLCLFAGIVRSLKIENPHLQRVNCGFKFLNASATSKKSNL